MIGRWSKWKTFPNPAKGGLLIAPFSFELRNGRQLVCHGESKNAAARMTSLLPAPIGAGTREDKEKREYVSENLAAIEYRTIAFKQGRHACLRG